MRYLLVLVLVLVAGLGFAGCDQETNELPDEFKNAIPKSQIVKLAVPGAEDGDEALRQALEAAKADGDVKAKFYLDTINGVRELNTMTWALLHLVDDITTNPYTEEIDNGYVWGPHTPALSLVTIKFTLEKAGDNHFSYSLQFRKKEDSNGAFEDVLTGQYESTGGALKSKGTMVLDFLQAKALDQTAQASGVLTFDYDTTGEGRAIDITLTDFQDKAMDEPVNATYGYTENGDLSGEYGFSIVGDVHADDPERQDLILKENLSYHVRWMASGMGRADVIVTGGDLPSVTPSVESFQVSECWDEFFNRVYYQETVVPVEADPWEGVPVGDGLKCVFTEAEFR